MFSVLSDTFGATELFASFLGWAFFCVFCLVGWFLCCVFFFPLCCCMFLSVAVWMEADFMEADLSPKVELQRKTK